MSGYRYPSRAAAEADGWIMDWGAGGEAARGSRCTCMGRPRMVPPQDGDGLWRCPYGCGGVGEPEVARLTIEEVEP